MDTLRAKDERRQWERDTTFVQNDSRMRRPTELAVARGGVNCVAQCGCGWRARGRIEMRRPNGVAVLHPRIERSRSTCPSSNG
eukprot:4552924-Pyramimonas_sp.AAC.1